MLAAAVTEDIAIACGGARFGGEGFLEEHVLVGGVVGHDVHDDLDAGLMRGLGHGVEVVHLSLIHILRYIRLDAVGYGAKEAGTSCFMTPKTFKLISRLREEGVKRGLEILIEVHSYYKKQVEIASKVDRVYDFALPPLLLHSLFTGHVEPVAHWTEIRPNNAVTVLDTHDGIGVIDIGSDQLDRSLKGLVPDEDVDNLVNTIHANTCLLYTSRCV